MKVYVNILAAHDMVNLDDICMSHIHAPEITDVLIQQVTYDNRHSVTSIISHSRQWHHWSARCDNYHTTHT